METTSKWGAAITCGGMTIAYVAVLYSPTLIFRRPPPTSFHHFMMRRFVSALFSSLFCLFFSSYILHLIILPSGSLNVAHLLGAYGVRGDHFWRAVGCSFSLTCLMYAGSFVLKALLLFDSWRGSERGIHPFSLSDCLYDTYHYIYDMIISFASNIAAWRNLVVAPLTEELVFRACMIPVLLCGGFKPLATVLLCSVFFSLAHLNHLFEFYSRKNCSVLKTSLAVGTQLAYTMVFGSYASFLFIRTGHFIAPLVAHIVCNFMGLPVVYSKRGVVVCLASVAGAIGFLRLLMPLTLPALYNFSPNRRTPIFQQ